VSASFLHRIDLCSIWCQILVQEKTCISRLVQVYCTRFLTVCQWHKCVAFYYCVSTLDTGVSSILSVGLWVCLCVQKASFGKTADWIRIRLGWWVGSVERLVYWMTDEGGEFGASHWNQWGLCCIVVRKCVNRPSCRLGGELSQLRHSCIRWSIVAVPSCQPRIPQ